MSLREKINGGLNNSKGRKISRNIFFLSWVSFFLDLSSEMIFPILPLFLASVLGANMAAIGLIEGLAESASHLFRVVSGWSSDKLKRKKPFIVFGYLVSAISKPVYGLAGSWIHVLGIRFVDRTGKGIREPPRDALMAEETIKKTRGSAFGFQNMLDNLGAVAGNFIAFILLGVFVVMPYRKIFFLSAIPAIIAVIILIFFVKEKKKASKAKAPFFKGLKSLFNLSIFDRKFKLFLFVSTLFWLGNFSYAFFILKASELGVAAAMIPLMFLLYNVFYSLSSYPMGELSDIIGRKKVIFAGYLLFSIVCVAFAFSSSILLVWVLFAFYGLFNAIEKTIPRAFVSDMVKKDVRAEALGVYSMFVGIAAFPSSLIAGFIWNSFGSKITFFYGAGIGLMSAVLLLALLKKKGRK